jgi:Domain of unknown function (DUF4145)
MKSDAGSLKLKCPRCGIAMLAEVRASYRWDSARSPSKPYESHFAICAGCDEPFLVEYYRDMRGLFEDLSVAEVVRDGVSIKEWVKLYPLEFVPNAPEHLPVIVEAYYKEACACLVNGYANAAGAMFRKTLEAATRAQEIVDRLPTNTREKYQQLWLATRLKALKDHGCIPESLYELTDTLKSEGDEAVHAMTAYTVPEANELKGFADALLNFLFTMPNKIRSVRTAGAKRETP